MDVMRGRGSDSVRKGGAMTDVPGGIREGGIAKGEILLENATSKRHKA